MTLAGGRFFKNCGLRLSPCRRLWQEHNLSAVLFCPSLCSRKQIAAMKTVLLALQSWLINIYVAVCTRALADVAASDVCSFEQT
eukprot:364398-Chlamydomonas_euryale.AAC.2